MTAEGETPLGRVLVVDDAPLNRMLLDRALRQEGYETVLVDDGVQALSELRASNPPSIDVVLLDVVMPNMDGYQALSVIKSDARLRHIPVIMITAVDEVDSIVRCIELGAMDYLSKPFNAAVLRARIAASLAAKRLRDLELEYLEQVQSLTAAAAAVEAGAYDACYLDRVAARDDALGQLARVFRRMADEVRAREDRLRHQVQELQIEIDEGRQAQRIAEITESEFYQSLRSQARDLRKIIDS